jgi:hypothetical protein
MNTDTAPKEIDPEFEWDGDPDKVPNYKQDNDWFQAITSQFRLIRGVRGKLRAVGVIILRMLP